MITELFFPRELKNAIAELEAKNDLNKEAMRNFKQSLYPLCLLTMLLLIWTLNKWGREGDDIELSIALTFLSFLCVFWKASSLWRTFYAAYLTGEKRTGTVKKVRYRPYYTLSLDVLSSNASGIHSIYMPLSSKVCLPRVEQDISYYLSENQKYGPVPLVSPYMKKRCLSLSILKENN